MAGIALQSAAQGDLRRRIAEEAGNETLVRMVLMGEEHVQVQCGQTAPVVVEPLRSANQLGGSGNAATTQPGQRAEGHQHA